MMQSRSGTNRQKSFNCNQQDVKFKLERRGDQDQDELLPLLRRGRGRGGPTTVGRNSKQLKHKINNQLGRRGTSVMGMRMGSLPLPFRNRRARQNMPSLGLPFQPGNGDLDRRGPIQDMEILPGRRYEPPFRRQRQQVLPPAPFDGAIISDGEEEDEEVEEHEYLPTRSKIGSGNRISNVSMHLVSADHEHEHF